MTMNMPMALGGPGGGGLFLLSEVPCIPHTASKRVSWRTDTASMGVYTWRQCWKQIKDSLYECSTAMATLGALAQI